VSGVGPKTAVSIFAIGTSDEIQRAITLGNVEYFTPVPRLGRKNAQKIIIELKNKLGSKIDLDLSGQEMQENKDVIAALRTFGFSAKEAGEALKQVEKSLSPEEKIRQALKVMGK
jgi:Holliday junction DNA helicase RuvA